MTIEDPAPKKRMSLKKKILVWVASIFAGLIVLSIVINIADPEGMDDVRAEQQADREAKASEKAAAEAANASAKALAEEVEASAKAAEASQQAKDEAKAQGAEASKQAVEQEGSTQEDPQPTDSLSPQCLEVSASLQSDIASEASGARMTPVRAAGFKSPDYPSAYLIAMEFSSPGGGNEVGIWQSSTLDSGSPIYAVDGMAKVFTNWKHSGDSVVPLDLSSAGVAESKACLG